MYFGLFNWLTTVARFLGVVVRGIFVLIWYVPPLANQCTSDCLFSRLLLQDSLELLLRGYLSLFGVCNLQPVYVVWVIQLANDTCNHPLNRCSEILVFETSDFAALYKADKLRACSTLKGRTLGQQTPNQRPC